MTITNQQRATWAKAALDAYLKAKGECPDPTPEDDASDLICDLMHLLQRAACDPQRAIRCADTNFRAEILEERDGVTGILDPDNYQKEV